MEPVQLFALICLAAVCAAQIPATTIPPPPPPPPPTEPTPTPTPAPPVPQLQQVSTRLEVFPSESVELRCDLGGASSGWSVLWKQNQQALPADPNLSLSEDGALLTITAAAQIQSGSYECVGRHDARGTETSPSNSLQVTVHANKPKPGLSRNPNFREMFSGESVTFTCAGLPGAAAGGWEYLWYHNGIESPGAQTLTVALQGVSDGGQYQCRGQREPGPFMTELSDTVLLQVNDVPIPTVRLLSTWTDVFPEEEVSLNCEVSDEAWTVSWYRDQKKLVTDPYEDESYFNITTVTSEHQGEYTCRAHFRSLSSNASNNISITVHDKPTSRLTPVPNHSPMYPGETVVFTCAVGVSSGWDYTWSQNGVKLLSETGDTLSVTLSRPSDAAKYSCQASRGETETHASAEIQLVFQNIPVPQLKRLTEWLDVFPSESVKLACELTDGGSDWTFSWFRDGAKVQADPTVSLDPDGRNLSISAAAAKHAGQYSCQVHLQDRSVKSNPSPGLNLMVHAEIPNAELTQDPGYEVMFPGETVNFSCHTSVSTGWKYFFSKNLSPLSSSGASASVALTGASDGGSYTCVAKRGTDQVFSIGSSPAVLLDVKGKKPKPLMLQEPKADKVYVGESVSWECKVETSLGWEYLWTKDQVPLARKNHTLTIQRASLSDSGTFECKAQRDRSTYQTLPSDTQSLQVLEIPVPKLKVTHWPDVFPTECVKMSCGMEKGGSDWKYTWYKDAKKVQADDVASFDADGTMLSISSAAAKHGGHYSCSGTYKSRSVQSARSSEEKLSVYDTKPRVTIQTLKYHEVQHTGDPVFFSCHVNVSSGWQYLWYKDNSLLTQLNNNNNHSIVSVQTGNSGSYTCQVQRTGNTIFESARSPGVKFIVEERPQAQVILLTRWSDVFSTDTLLLECSVPDGRHTWNYTWFREADQLQAQASESHLLRVTPQNDPDQSQYTCLGNHSERPTYSKSSDSFRTKNLLLKRRVLLSISGCLFFGLIAVFLGCIVLRVTRKRAIDDEKPEEENLFLTMAQLKDRTDAPNPLVEYMTDDDLNAPEKEAESNGTVCNETTPLPITAQEDQAVTSVGESEETSESNGGLVSFKQ